MKQTTTKNQIYIVDITVAPGVNFYHRNQLASQKYWAVFTHWPTSLHHIGSIMPLATGGSWYLIRKQHYIIATAQPYMDERLGARTKDEKIDCALQLQNAFRTGTSLKGTIDSITPQSSCGHSNALEASIQELGKIIMIDSVSHPKLTYLIDHPQCTIYGRGAYPWAPIKQKGRLLKKYKM